MTSDNFSAADIAAITGNGRQSGGFGYGGGLEWIIILFLFAMFGGWGNNGNGAMSGGMGGSGNLYPWLNNSNQINDGFQNQLMNDNITSIREGVYGINNQLCSGFAGVNASVNNAQNAIAQQMYANQIADMQQSFALQSQLAQCCCDNRMATADLKYTVATENCADRNQALLNTRDIMENCNRNYQNVMDKLCALELDGVKGQLAQAQRENVGLQNQLNMANLAASQIAQDQRIVDNIYDRLSQCPVGTTPVYGRTPIFTCNGNQGCGCNGGNGFYN